MAPPDRRETAEAWTYDRVVRAREAVDALLDELELDAYLFGVEPRADHWEARVEFATLDGWRTATLRVSEPDLFASLDSRGARQRVLDTWRSSFSDAKRAGPRA